MENNAQVKLHPLEWFAVNDPPVYWMNIHRMGIKDNVLAMVKVHDGFNGDTLNGVLFIACNGDIFLAIIPSGSKSLLPHFIPQHIIVTGKDEGLWLLKNDPRLKQRFICIQTID